MNNENEPPLPCIGSLNKQSGLLGLIYRYSFCNTFPILLLPWQVSKPHFNIVVDLTASYQFAAVRCGAPRDNYGHNKAVPITTNGGAANK